MDRRKFIPTALGLGIIGLAGCSIRILDAKEGASEDDVSSLIETSAASAQTLRQRTIRLRVLRFYAIDVLQDQKMSLLEILRDNGFNPLVEHTSLGPMVSSIKGKKGDWLCSIGRLLPDATCSSRISRIGRTRVQSDSDVLKAMKRFRRGYVSVDLGEGLCSQNSSFSLNNPLIVSEPVLVCWFMTKGFRQV